MLIYVRDKEKIKKIMVIKAIEMRLNLLSGRKKLVIFTSTGFAVNIVDKSTVNTIPGVSNRQGKITISKLVYNGYIILA